MYEVRDRRLEGKTAPIEDVTNISEWPFAIDEDTQLPRVVALVFRRKDAHHIVRLLNGESKDWTAVGQTLEALYEAYCEDMDDCQDELDNLMEAYDKWLG